MNATRTYIAGAAIGCVMLAACSRQSPAPADGAVIQSSTDAPAAAQLTDADLEQAVRAALAATGMEVGDTRYFDATADLNGDGSAERLVYLVGPMTCGSGGCPLYLFTPEQRGYRFLQEFSVVRAPVRLSPRSSHGWRNLVVHVAGGGAAAADVELAHDGTGYPPNPTVEPARPITDLAGTEILIADFGSYTDGTPLAAAEDTQAAVYGDPQLPVAGRVLGTEVHTSDAEELRYVVLLELTDRYADAKGITVTQAEKEAYVAHLREVLSKDPAVAATLGEDTVEDRAARMEIAGAFIRQWKINRALHEQYGGRVIFQQGGPEPLDAYRAFLEERQAAGDFTIADDAMGEGFWRYYRNDDIHSFYAPGSAEEQQALATAPWSSD